jgi:hypothetical protein
MIKAGKMIKAAIFFRWLFGLVLFSSIGTYSFHPIKPFTMLVLSKLIVKLLMKLFISIFQLIDNNCFLSQFLLIRFLPVLIFDFSFNVYEGNPLTPSLSPWGRGEACLPVGRGEGD